MMGRLSSGDADAARSAGEGVAVGMSGGVDSSAAAHILRERGYDVVGVTLKFFCLSDRTLSPRACCSRDSIRRAKSVCNKLGIPHKIIDVEELFDGKVVRYFVREYRRGRTPNPCIVCNEKVKFPAIADFADRMGLRWIATGHYAGLDSREDGSVLLRAAENRAKDQSYFLYRVAVKHLSRTIFPVGDLSKAEAAAKVSRLGFKAGEKRESQDICFLPDGDIGAFIAASLGTRDGDVVDMEGKIIGRHNGHFYYTIGQRRGLGIAGDAPMYVREIDAIRNRIVLAPEDKLFSRTVRFAQLRLRGRKLGTPLAAKIRYRHGPAPLESITRDKSVMIARFRQPQRAVTPGQSIVLYRNGFVLGGGVIESSDRG
jgi:tRNA-specific 2-thiouridylase